ncbi:LppP/LprE family lipoprotein [Mycobacterium sp.]|uniref:LppP/LprE family lipoprotein n=1 Tax=Mycobacterium sp. TaxID=1785 RepID=UPI002D07BEDF|nr:LppP/LprE family lipoprotein [Mycobacterium sp.]HTH86748.1 LppP/LprE family lipoprotein [Mycobacterium sp.]
MRPSRLMTVVLVLGLTAAGCGFKPPAAPPTTSAACTQADGPSADTVAAEIAKLPAAQWSEIVSGHTADCNLHWVVVTSGDASDSPGQVLFFDRKSPIGPPTPDPRPYITINAIGNNTAAVQYQWRQGQEPACCPTGVATVRFKIEDGKLKALDPIPNA